MGDLEYGDGIIVASQLLLGRARRRLESLDGQPTARAIDAIESDLRWVGRLREDCFNGRFRRFSGLPAVVGQTDL